MKVRNGFISNSSSSSFLIAVPKGADLTQTIERLKARVCGSGLPFSDVLCALYSTLVASSKLATMKDLGECINEEFSEDNIYVNYARKGLAGTHDIYMGSAWDDKSTEETMLCNTHEDYESDEICIWTEGEY